jgi:GT2 family glycosyltransferase
MKVGIVMPAINLWDKYTKQALDSVYEALAHGKINLDSDVLFIDNASSDNTRIEALKYFIAHSESNHRNEEMWGFQKSVNFGVKHFFRKEYGYDYVLVLNNDIVLHKDAIWQLVKRFEQGGVGMVTCLDVSGEMNGAHKHPSKISEIKTNEKDTCPESPHPNFSAFMINRECWDKVGEFDEVFAPAYHEDNDFHYRMKLAGVLSVCYPPAMFYHYGSRTQNESLGRPLVSGSAFDDSRTRYITKWGGIPTKEVFTHPYNAEDKDITSVKQNEK